MDNLPSHNIFSDNKVIIAGDFNINLLEHNTNPPTNNFLSTMQSQSYFPHTFCPTQFPDDNSSAAPSLLDHIWTIFSAPFSPGIILYPLTDHLPVFLNIPSLESIKEKYKITFRIRDIENCYKFRTHLSEINWNSLYHMKTLT